MTHVARVGNFERVRHGRTHKMKRMAAHIDVAQRLRDFRHVTGDALAALTVRLVMRVPGECGGVRAVGRTGTVAVQA